MKYIFVTNSPFNKRDSKRFGVDYFLNKNYQCIVVDITKYTHPNLVNENKYIDSNTLLQVCYCDNADDIRHIIATFKPEDICLLSIGSTWKEVRLRKFIYRSRVKIGIIRAGLIPQPTSPVTLKHSTIHVIVKRLKEIGLRGLALKIGMRFYSRLYSVPLYDFLITSNYTTYLSQFSETTAKKVIEAHNMDYDRVLEKKDNKFEYHGEYAVFIDQYLPAHSDFVRMGIEQPVELKSYTKSLNDFFSRIEKQYNVKVLIALHPRSDNNYRNYFKNYRTFINQTELLVQKAEFVMMHYSTAINYAVLYNKPICFIETNEIKNTRYHNYIQYYADLLDQSIVNVDTANDFITLNNINSIEYAKYKNDYIKKDDTPDKPLWDIFYEQYINSIGRTSART